jgi:hypothetical protein
MKSNVSLTVVHDGGNKSTLDSSCNSCSDWDFCGWLSDFR